MKAFEKGIMIRVTGDNAVRPVGCICDRTLRAEEIPDLLLQTLVAVEDRRLELRITQTLRRLRPGRDGVKPKAKDRGE